MERYPISHQCSVRIFETFHIQEERLPPGFVAAAAPSEFKSSSSNKCYFYEKKSLFAANHFLISADCSCNEYYNALKNECECKPGYSKYYNQTCLPSELIFDL